jgi:hypothetical protein
VASGADKGHKCQRSAGEEEQKNRAVFFFWGVSTPFFTSLNFISRVTSIFFNSVLIKNVEMDSSFFYNFLFQFFKNFKFDQPIFQSMR